MNYNLEWKQAEGKYETGKNCYLGKWHVGSAFYDGSTSRGNPNKYRATCTLPGIKNTLGHFLTEEEAKQIVIKVVGYWINNTGIQA